MTRAPNVNDANKYARDVVSGNIEVCKWVHAACKRHLDDLKSCTQKTSPWLFNKILAEDACNFIQRLPHIKGTCAADNELITLQPWQKFIVCSVFGWCDKKSGLRRFREVYCEIPRKNGKSLLAAAIGLYLFVRDREHYAEVYCGATTLKQALEVFEPARLMVKKTPDLMSAAGIEVRAMNMSVPKIGNRFEPLTGDPGDGASPSCAIVDEFHEHKTSKLYETMISGMSARKQPLMFVVTTAGYNLAGPCYMMRTQAKDTLLYALGEGSIDSTQLFAVIYTIDEEDDWQDPSALRKANPNWGVSVSESYVLKLQKEAGLYPSRVNNFKTKHLNLWVSARSAWLNMASWAACARPGLNLDQFRGKKCWLGVDLASQLDVTAVALVFKEKDTEGRTLWTVFCRSYLPEGAIERAVTYKQAYQAWAHTGELIKTDGEETDFDFIREEIKALAKEFSIEEIVYDKWRATQLGQQLSRDGAVAIEMGSGASTMNAPMRELEAALSAGRFSHPDNGPLSWMAGNVAVKEYKGCLVPMKEDEGKGNLKKIDGIVAILMAMSRALSANQVLKSLLEHLDEEELEDINDLFTR